MGDDLAQAFRDLADAIRSQGRPAAENTQQPPEEWMDVDSAANWLGIHEQTLRETIAAENPAWARRVGRAIRVSRTLLLQADPESRPRKRSR